MKHFGRLAGLSPANDGPPSGVVAGLAGPPRRAGLLGLMGLLALSLTGCPPTGDVPAYDPIYADAATDGAVDAALDPCEDFDDDGYVVGSGCALPAGDCAPTDPARNPGADEACNLRDDDCDGVTDEGNPGSGAACTSDLPGICAAGRTACRQGSLACDPIAQRAVSETCNGLDDDCDGNTDEEVPGLGGNCETGEPGVCARGAQACDAAMVRCVSAQMAGAERCNGLDDDCDGSTDEGDPDGGGACNTALAGICGVGVLRCSGGEAACTQSVQPVPETCNGLDDDCDGNTDETWPTKGDACSVGVGACSRTGALDCTADGTAVVCDAVAGAVAAERCNSADDDCDGRLDEGFALGENCTNGVGACQRPGLTVCDAGGASVVCGAEPGESFDERCNAVDDDCDGRVDELFPTLRQPCVDASGQCPSPGLFACAANGNGVTCVADPVQPVAETCNDFDDDCDGRTDETYPAKGSACAVGVGACARSGEQVCGDDGGLACSVVPGAPMNEACNGLDDDCDGRVDEGAPCIGAPAGVVVAIRVAAPGDPACGVVPGDITPDHAFAGLADLLDVRLARALAAGDRPLIVRASGAPVDGFALDFLEAVTDADGAAVPRLDALSASGAARASLSGYRLAAGQLAGGNVGAMAVPSLLVYAPALPAPRLASLRSAKVTGPLALVPVEGASGLAGVGLTLTAHLDRDTLLADYAVVDAACAAANPMPDDCVDRPSPAALAAALVADVDADNEGGPDAVSLCLRFDLEPTVGPATPPVGPVACTADSECYAGLVCRAVPWLAANPALGNALARRCAPPGAGDAPVGAACDGDDECRRGLCLKNTAQGGVCSDLCSGETCGVGLACRGVPVAVEGAIGAGGNSANLCVATPGSGAICGARNSCAGGEVCAPFLGGAVGVAGGAVTVAPRCHTPTPGAAALGAACADDLDCAHGLGCVTNLSNRSVCAALCTGGSQCAAGEVCTPRPVPVGADVSRTHGMCLAVPAVLGSGRRCASDATCAPTETCRSDFLAPTGGPDAFCGVGTGFYAVGQPCAAGNECLSGVCAAGFCSGPCQTVADCGPASACNAGGWTDRVSGAVTGACGPIAGACVLDRDCNARSPACQGDRCVCEDNLCRLGCRAGGNCLDGGYCQADGVCTPYCPVDRAEPDDTVAQALILPFGRGTPSLNRDASLCATSPLDHYQFVGNGQGFTARVTPQAVAGVRLEVAILSAAGAVLASAESGGAQAPAAVQVVLNAALATAQAGQPLVVRVRAAGTFDSLSYNLALTLQAPACTDPDVTEPQDEPWQVTELLATPGAAANVLRDAAICPADTDWYGLYLGNGDTLTARFTNLGNAVGASANLEATLIGPDWPALPGATTRATLVSGQDLVFTPPQLDCDLAASLCRFADGTPTEIKCDGSANQCAGIGWFFRVAGSGLFDRADYRLSVSVARASAPTCVPDLFEHDALFQTPTRIYGAVGSQAIDVVNSNFTFPLGVPVTLRGRRLCGQNGSAAEDAEVDHVSIYARGGETLRVGVAQPAPVQPLTMRIMYTRDVPASQVFTAPAAVASASAEHVVVGFGVHGVAVTRPKNQNTPGYVDSAPYTFTLERLPFGFEADQACTAPKRLNLQNNRATDTGNLVGSRDDHRPLTCPGGRGPDRTYVVTVPAGGGVLRATVTALDEAMDPEVAIRGTCNAANSEIACNADDLTSPEPADRALAQGVVQGGNNGRDYFIHVDSPDAERTGGYQLDLRYLTAAECNLETGVCNDPCAGVQCGQGLFCDTNDGACVACLVDNQCNSGSRCLSRRCVPGADRPISSWGDDGQNEPDCGPGLPDCTVSESCVQLPFSGGRFCAMSCGNDLACPQTFDCCVPKAIVAQFGVLPSCIPSTHPFRTQLCEP